MNLKEWKEIRNHEMGSEITYRDMIGFIRYLKNSELAAYFPETMISALQKNMPQATIMDIYYVIEKWYENNYIFELILLKIAIEKRSFDVELSFERRSGNWELRFSYSVDGKSETTEETEKFMCAFYQYMRDFLEENSPNRLFLLTSPLVFYFPTWLTQQVKR